MREISYIVIHCTATQPTAKPESILNYWKKELGWKKPGYHYLIKANGIALNLLPEDQISNGVAGYNSHSVHVSYIGGIDPQGLPKDTRTPEQIDTMIALVRDLKRRYPKAVIQGHRDFPKVTKACPSFDVKSWWKALNAKTESK